MLREYRIELAHVDRGIECIRKLLVQREAGEDDRHLALRVLSWCLLCEDDMTFGGGPSMRDAPDLETRDPGGRLHTWVDCGDARLEQLLKVLQHNRDACAHIVMCDGAPRQELLSEIESLRQRPTSLLRATLWMLEAGLVDRVAAWEEHRQRWSVTVVGDHMYVTGAAGSVDGEVRRERLDEPGR